MSPFIASLPFQGKVTCDQEFFFSVRRYRGIIGRGNDLRLRGRQRDRQPVGRSWSQGRGTAGGGDDFFSIFPGTDFVLC